MKSKELEQLIFNPFHTSKILHHFLTGVDANNKNGIKTELIGIVLPIIYNDVLVNNSLSTLNVKSNFKSLISVYEFKVFATQINDEIKNFRSLTNNSLIILANTNDVIVSDFIKVKNVIDYHHEKDITLKKIYKASYNLGSIMAKENYLSIFLKLKITEL
ncbi:three component ABC system middle component [Flavobacterium sp.]|uniref:three component ABC system middle component n=1 Tax=Flavobacterium sp. TaxID=239 RepID=UPI0038FC5F30